MLVVVATLPALIALTFGAGPTLARLLASLAILGLGIQLRLDGYRWQMLPAYVLVVSVVVLAAMTRPSLETLRRWISAGEWILCLIAASTILAFPLPREPLPTGPFGVGTDVRYLVDASRRETLKPGVQGPRELMIQFWYPTAKVSAQPARQRWWEWLSERQEPRLQAVTDAPLASAEKSYPVLIFSPSWHGQRWQNRFQMDELASQGFIVVGIDHPYSSTLTVFPDGRRAEAEPIDFFDLSSDEALARSTVWIETVLRVRVKDIEFVADELEKIDAKGSGDRFSERLDLNRLGVFGYSFGGATAAQVCWEDPRFKAGMNMSGSMYGEVAEVGIRQPFLFLGEWAPRPTADELKGPPTPARRYAAITEQDYRQEGHSAETYGSYALQIRKAEHIDLTDPPEKPSVMYYLHDHGSIAPERVMRIINAYTVAFFDRSLNHTSAPLLDGPSPDYPEVVFIYPQKPKT